MPKKIGISDRTAERLNALMRPKGDVQGNAQAQGLFAAIAEECDPAAALAYVFEAEPFAYWSGPKTPAGDFPKSFDQSPGSKDTEEFMAFQDDGKSMRRLIALVAQIEADEPDAAERAARAWTFLQTVKSRVGRAVLFAMMLDDSTFVSPATPFIGEARYTDTIPNDECDQIMWRNRGVIARLNGIRSSGTITQKAALGSAVLEELANVADARERAFILGGILGKRQNDIEVRALAIDLPAGIKDLAARVAEVVEAAANGKPCPICGTVHGKGDVPRGDEHV